MARPPKSPHPPRLPLTILTELSTRRGREFSDALQRYLFDMRERHSWYPCVLDLPGSRESDLSTDEGAMVLLDSDHFEKEAKRLNLQSPSLVVSGSNPAVGKLRCNFVTDGELIGALAADHLLRHGYRKVRFVANHLSPHHDAILSGFSREMNEVEHRVLFHDLMEFRETSPKKSWGIVTLDDEAHRYAVEKIAERGKRRVRDQVLAADFSSSVDPATPQFTRDPTRAAEAVVSELLSKDIPGTEEKKNEPIALSVKAPEKFARLRSLDTMVSDASDFIDENLSNLDLSTDWMAASIDVSRRTLERRFREVVGNSILQEIQRRRTLKARILLTTARVKPEIAASNCGFSSSRMLALAFQRFTGSKPRAYQREFLSRTSSIF